MNTAAHLSIVGSLTLILTLIDLRWIASSIHRPVYRELEAPEATQGSGGAWKHAKGNFLFSGRGRLAVFIKLIFTCIMHRTHLVDAFETKLHNLYFVNRRPRRPATISSGSFLLITYLARKI